MAESEVCRTNSKRLRPSASPRPSPPSSRGSFDLGSPIEEPDATQSTPSSGAQSPLRGRTLHRIPRRPQLVSCATTRRYTNLDTAHGEWEDRLAKHGLTETTSDLDHSLLEPLPNDRFRTSLSEELHRAATFDSTIDLSTFGGHRDTFSLIQLRNLRNPFNNLPLMSFEHISRYLDFETYKAVRLTCHSWSVAISKARPVKTPSVIKLPAEVLEHIYIALSPIDFNAARHTCRAWMRTSLEPRLSMLMLKRGGWVGTVAADSKVTAGQNADRRSSIGNNGWLLSKRLATECSLSPGWSGHGIHKDQTTVSGLQLTSQIDFSQLGVDSSQSPTNHESGANICFTISTCTNFLLANQSRVIYIHALRRTQYDGSAQPYGGCMELVTSIVCPDHVLAVSMDTSCKRYSVAALLRGAVGIVHDLDLVRYSEPLTGMNTSGNRIAVYDRRQGSVFIPPLSAEQSQQQSALYTQATFGTVYTTPRNHTNFLETAEVVYDETHSEAFRSRTWALGCRFSPPQSIETAFHAYGPFQIKNTSGGPFSAYRNLCQIDDPPRSVAICPQRRCVAFGCQRGVELHWMDALTGQDMSRWFSLISPADHLFFMPARDDMDGSRKLRLISSTSAPGPVIDRSQNHPGNQRGVDSRNHHETDQNNLTGTIPSSPIGPEYHTAIPLSDGRHLLLTLPDTGELCLVKDKPRTLEAVKFIRRFSFVGPTTDEGIPIVPQVYAAAAELKWGVRVAVAYEDRLWLFMVPPDLFFERNKSRRRSNTSGFQEDNNPITVRVAGVEIASIVNLTCLTLDASAGDLTVWALSKDATASISQLCGSGRNPVAQHVALSDGTIVLAQDMDGDTVMTDSPDPRDTEEDVVMTDAWNAQDVDGDIFMTDLTDPPEEQALQSDGTASFTQDWPSSCVPCFPCCDHTYCNHLLHLDNGTLRKNDTIHSRPLEAGSNVNISLQSSVLPDYPPIPASYNPLLDDEGYASEDDEFEVCHSSMYVPPFSHQDEDAEWVPEYLRQSGTDIEDEGLGLDVIELCRCECEIFGN